MAEIVGVLRFCGRHLVGLERGRKLGGLHRQPEVLEHWTRIDDSDRACNESARAENLEIICQTDEPPRFVYCPAETGRSDSKVVWLLLAVACAIATVGGTTLYRAIKKDA